MNTYIVSFTVEGQHYEAKVNARNENEASLLIGVYTTLKFAVGASLDDLDFTNIPADLNQELVFEDVKKV